MLVDQRANIEEEIHILSTGSCEEEVLVSQMLGNRAPKKAIFVPMISLSGWWFRTLYIFFYILGMPSSQLMNSYFSEG